MKNIVQIILLLIAVFGSYRLGKLGSDIWWMQEVGHREQHAINAVLEAEKNVDHSLYDWKRPIRTAIYVGCIDKHPLRITGVTIDGTDLDYGIWINCYQSAATAFNGGIIELGEPLKVDGH